MKGKLTAEAYKAYMETRYLARPQIRRDAGKGTGLLAKCAITDTKACAVTLPQLQFESGRRRISVQDHLSPQPPSRVGLLDAPEHGMLTEVYW